MSNTSDIRFKIELDDESIPEKIYWEATDGPIDGLQETKAFTISIWDHTENNTLRIDLWQKDMPVDDMKKFYIDTIGGMANSLKTSTDDEYMVKEMETLCDRLLQYLKSGKTS